MPVDSRNADYEHMYPKWRRVRDAIEGEDAIKAGGKKYLPIPAGIEQPWGENDPQYLNYLRRAVYPEVVAPTIQGMVGLMSRKEVQIDIPTPMEDMRDSATPEGLGLDGLLRRTQHEVMALGRYIYFIDAPADGGEPYIATYPAEALINWRTDGDRVTLAVFEETVTETKPGDPFAEEHVTQWRVASVEAGETGAEEYVVRVFRKAPDGEGGNKFLLVGEARPRSNSITFDFVPVVIIGSRDLLPDADRIPMLGVVNRTLDYYRQSADYRLGLFMSTQATPYGTGLGQNEGPTTVGPSTFWRAESPDARFGYAEVSGNGLSAQKEALDATRSEIMDEAMRIIGDGRRAAESGEALRLRFQSQTATLVSVAQATTRGLQVALQIVAQWRGLNPADVEVTLDTQFIHEEPDPQVLTGIADMVERGLLPETVLAGYLRRTNLSDLSDEEFARFAPALAADPGGAEDA